MQLLALDIATKTGWAETGGGSLPLFGTLKLKTPDDDSQRAVRNLACWLRDKFMVTVPDVVVYEAPLNSAAALGAGNSYRTPDFLLQMVGAVEAVCGCYGIPTRKMHVQSVRKRFLGHGRPNDPKRAVISHCRTLGADVRNDNEADAVAIWFVQNGYRFGEMNLAGATE